jgi:multidrug efflux system membrane fusion protein
MRWKPLVFVLVVALGLASAAAWGLQRNGKKESPQGSPGGPPSVPVSVAPVEEQDFPVYLEGLGNVAAFYTVTVRSQVDGRVDRVAFTEGQPVKKGQLLAQIDPRPFEIQLRQGEATLARDRAQLKNAQLNFDRYKTLRGEKLIPEQQLSDQQAAVDQAEATVHLDEAAIDNAKLMLDYSRIVSPIDGRTGVRQIDPGNLIKAGDPNGIVVITQLDPIAVFFTLPEDDLPAIARQMKAGPLQVEARSRDGTAVLGTGTVLLVDNQINQTTGTIRLKAVFPNPDTLLWPNQFVKARLLLETKPRALVIPASVVQRGPKGAFAYVVGQDQKVVAKPIVVDQIAGDTALITEGLKRGEMVVVEGQYRLAPGTRVAARPATPEGARTASSTVPLNAARAAP